DLRREHQTPAATATLDTVVAELGRTRDNLKSALQAVSSKPISPGGKPIIDELSTRARAAGIDDLDYGPDPFGKPPPEPLEKAARRQLSAKLFKAGDPKSVGKGRGQIEVQLNAGITDDIARDLRKRIQNVSAKLQVRIQGDQLRVVSKDKDTLQQVIKTLREAEDIPVPLQFTNYR